MSLDEERARQAAVSSVPAPASLEAIAESAATPAVTVKKEDDAFATPIKKEPVEEGDVSMTDEDEDLKRAMALSRGDDTEMGDADEEEDEEAAIAAAIAMSMKEEQE